MPSPQCGLTDISGLYQSTEIDFVIAATARLSIAEHRSIAKRLQLPKLPEAVRKIGGASKSTCVESIPIHLEGQVSGSNRCLLTSFSYFHVFFTNHVYV